MTVRAIVPEKCRRIVPLIEPVWNIRFEPILEVSRSGQEQFPRVLQSGLEAPDGNTTRPDYYSLRNRRKTLPVSR